MYGLLQPREAGQIVTVFMPEAPMPEAGIPAAQPQVMHAVSQTADKAACQCPPSTTCPTKSPPERCTHLVLHAHPQLVHLHKVDKQEVKCICNGAALRALICAAGVGQQPARALREGKACIPPWWWRCEEAWAMIVHLPSA